MTETYVVKAMNYNGRAVVEIATYEAHPTRGRVSANKRVRVPADRVLEVCELLIEAHAACRALVPDSTRY